MRNIDKFIPVLKRTKLFSGIGEEEIGLMLNCLQARVNSFTKGEYIFRQGEYIQDVAILVSGSLHMQKDDYWGNHSIINVINCGEMFCESYVTPDSYAILNDIVAVEDSVVIFFNINRILTSCSSACKFHTLVIQNLFFAISDKNRKLMQKISHISKRTTRDKLMSYLSEESKKHNNSTFEIPFNRQQLADFLSVDRSAMSNELGKMRDDGLLIFDKNKFTLL